MQCQAQGKAQTGVRAVGWAAIATLMPEKILGSDAKRTGKQKRVVWRSRVVEQRYSGGGDDGM
jgi:hypothetical protein